MAFELFKGVNYPIMFYSSGFLVFCFCVSPPLSLSFPLSPSLTPQ